MRLFNQIAWFAGYMDKPVHYDTYFISTIQDYMVSKSINGWVYDIKKNKRHQITLTRTRTKRDRNKSMRATFANCIHQLDATIAAHGYL